MQYLGSKKAAEDYTNLLRGKLPDVGRSAAAEPLMGRQGPTRDIYEVPGTGYFDRRSGRFLGAAPSAPQLPVSGTTPIIRGTLDGVTPDRTQSDEYKAQMAQYGALQKAKKFEDAEKLGMEIWEQKYGKTAMGQPGGVVGTDNPLMRSTFPEKYAPQAFRVPEGFDVSQSFSIGANAVPAPWNTQGAAVSAPYQQAMQQAAEKTTGEGMPDFSTTIGAKVADALRSPEYSRFLQK